MKNRILLYIPSPRTRKSLTIFSFSIIPCIPLPQVFKRHNPATAEEQEMMENLFDALCSCLMLAANRDRFLRGEGLQLMNLMLR